MEHIGVEAPFSQTFADARSYLGSRAVFCSVRH